MTRLNASLHDSLTPSTLNNLFTKKIYTVTDFLDYDIKLLIKFTNLTYREILDIRKQIIDKYSAKIQTGEKYHSYLLKISTLTPTNIKSFDHLLDGGFLSGSIYEICGFPSSGKTQFCLTIAANISLMFEKHIYFIDTKRDFCTKRLQNILETRNCNKESCAHILNRIKIKQINDQYELIAALYDIKNEISNVLKYSIIIIDSLPAIFYHTGDYNNTLAFINHFVNIMRYISVELQTSILITNILIKDSLVNNVNKPALGTFWHSVPNTRILLTKTDSNICDLSIIKSSTIELGKKCCLTLTDAGVI